MSRSRVTCVHKNLYDLMKKMSQETGDPMVEISKDIARDFEYFHNFQEMKRKKSGKFDFRL